MSNVEKWKKLLEVGENPVIDEENAADFLEAVQTHFWEKEDFRGPLIFIPLFRRMLSKAKLKFDPNFTNKENILRTSWTKELAEEMNEMEVDLSSEMVSIMSIELGQRLTEFGDTVRLNFDLSDNDIKFYVEPYETENV